MTDDLYSYVFARDEGLCLKCGDRASGSPHHVKYRSHGGKHCAMNLASVCNKCHFKIHNISDGQANLLLERIKENERKLRENLV